MQEDKKDGENTQIYDSISFESEICSYWIFLCTLFMDMGSQTRLCLFHLMCVTSYSGMNFSHLLDFKAPFSMQVLLPGYQQMFTFLCEYDETAIQCYLLVSCLSVIHTIHSESKCKTRTSLLACLISRCAYGLNICNIC